MLVLVRIEQTKRTAIRVERKGREHVARQDDVRVGVGTDVVFGVRLLDCRTGRVYIGT